jgi:hypothetical protein
MSSPSKWTGVEKADVASSLPATTHPSSMFCPRVGEATIGLAERVRQEEKPADSTVPSAARGRFEGHGAAFQASVDENRACGNFCFFSKFSGFPAL